MNQQVISPPAVPYRARSQSGRKVLTISGHDSAGSVAFGRAASALFAVGRLLKVGSRLMGADFRVGPLKQEHSADGSWTLRLPVPATTTATEIADVVRLVTHAAGSDLAEARLVRLEGGIAA